MLFKTVFYRLIMPKDKQKIFYAVGVGRKAGIYHTWSECKKQVDGVSNPKFRKFETLQEAEQFVSKWQNSGPSVTVSPATPKQNFDYCNFEIKSRSQEEHHGQLSKGDMNLKTIEKKGKTYHVDDSYYKGDNLYRKKMHWKHSENFCKHSVKQIYYSWNENGKGPKRRKSRAEGNFFDETKRRARRRNSVRKKREQNQIISHSPIEQNCKNVNVQVTATQNSKNLANQKAVQECKTVAPNWNATSSVSNSQAVLTDYQTQQATLPDIRNYSNCQQHLTIGQINCPFGYIQGTNTSACNRYNEIVNSDIWNIASTPLSGERCLPPLTPVKCNNIQGSANNDLLPNFGIAQTPVDNEAKNSPNAISTPCKTSKSLGERMEEIQILSEIDKSGENSVQCVMRPSSSEGNDVVGCAEQTINSTKIGDTSQDLSKKLNKYLETLRNIYNKENRFLVVFDVLVKILDVVRDFFKEIMSANVGGGQESEMTHFSKVKVSQSRECRNSNSFSGELEPMIANEASTRNDSEEGIGDLTYRTFMNARLGVCERKVNMCVDKLGEILSCFTDLKGEILQLKMPAPCNSAALSKEMGGRKFDSKISSGFSRTFASQCDAEEGDGTSKTQEQSSQMSQAFRHVGDKNQEEPPTKRKRTWDYPSTATSREPKMDMEFKQELDDYVSFTTDKDDYVVVYTDGSCTCNGTELAKAGIGIWFDDGHPLNVSKPLSGAEPTNNNAEIQAARIACELALSAGISKLKICTDSEFLINCITKWVHKWKANGWLTGTKQPVKNRVELEKLLEVISHLSVRWEKVAGHTSIKGNEMADRLANEGAARYVKQ